MPKYNVHLYTPYREKYIGIVAPDPVAAVRRALGRDSAETRQPAEVEDAEGMPLDALVDEIGADDDIVNGAGEAFDILPDQRIIPGHAGARDAHGACLDLVYTLAGMTIDGDTVAGEEYIADGNDDEVDALYAAVRRARAILGYAEQREH